MDVEEHERFCLHVATRDVDLPKAVTSVERCQPSTMQPDLLLDRSGLAVRALGLNRQETERA